LYLVCTSRGAARKRAVLQALAVSDLKKYAVSRCRMPAILSMKAASQA
jgi:hypothetical protein